MDCFFRYVFNDRERLQGFFSRAMRRRRWNFKSNYRKHTWNECLDWQDLKFSENVSCECFRSNCWFCKEEILQNSIILDSIIHQLSCSTFHSMWTIWFEVFKVRTCLFSFSDENFIGGILSINIDNSGLLGNVIWKIGRKGIKQFLIFRHKVSFLSLFVNSCQFILFSPILRKECLKPYWPTQSDATAQA